MQNSLSFDGNNYSFKLIDIRDMDPELFLESENPKEVILAILAGNDKKKRKLLINQIFNKLQFLTTSESELAERLEELEIISSLRGKRIEKFITKQKETMPITIDIRKTLRYQQAKAEGKAESKLETLIATAEKMLKEWSAYPTCAQIYRHFNCRFRKAGRKMQKKLDLLQFIIDPLQPY